MWRHAVVLTVSGLVSQPQLLTTGSSGQWGPQGVVADRGHSGELQRGHGDRGHERLCGRLCVAMSRAPGRAMGQMRLIFLGEVAARLCVCGGRVTLQEAPTWDTLNCRCVGRGKGGKRRILSGLCPLGRRGAMGSRSGGAEPIRRRDAQQGERTSSLQGPRPRAPGTPTSQARENQVCTGPWGPPWATLRRRWWRECSDGLMPHTCSVSIGVPSGWPRGRRTVGLRRSGVGGRHDWPGGSPVPSVSPSHREAPPHASQHAGPREGEQGPGRPGSWGEGTAGTWREGTGDMGGGDPRDVGGGDRGRGGRGPRGTASAGGGLGVEM